MDIDGDALNGVTITLVLLFACLVYALMAVWGGMGQFKQAVDAFDPVYGLVALLLVSAGYFVRFLRWHYYLEKMDFEVPFWPNLRIFLASFLMAISPGKVGEAMKSYFLKKEFGTPATPTVAAFFCERFTDVVAMVFLSGAGFLIYPHGGWVMAGIAILMLVMLFLIQQRTWIENLLFSPLEDVPFLSDWINRARRFYDRAGDLLSLKPLGVGTFLGLVSWGLEGIGFYVVLLGAGVGDISLPLAVFIFTAAVLLGAASMLPGGLGGSEAIMVAMLVYFDVTRPLAASTTILIRIITLWYGVLLGAITWAWSTRVLRQIESS